MEIVGGRPGELTLKILTERRAVLSFVDIVVITPATALPVLKPKGVLGNRR